MFKSLLFASLLTSALSGNAFSQTSNPDSIKRIAVADVQNFMLKEETIKKIRNQRSESSSDYFKPSKEQASNTSLLNDSIYVKAYRDAAYNKIRNSKAETKRGGIGTVGYVAGALAVFAVVFVGLNKM
ncbi:hypothetical protein [Pedobacter sp.]|uniref:hypothetical protein n=1 Tax=Pedobacter sp. TaxID=1411316 RepID=UPI003C3568C0